MGHKTLILMLFMVLLLSGCGGGGGGGDSKGSGLGSGLSDTSVQESNLRIVFPSVASLSLSAVSDFDLLQMDGYRQRGTFLYDSSENLSELIRQQEYLKFFSLSQSVKNQIARFRVVVTDSARVKLAEGVYPVTQQFAVLRVPAGAGRLVQIHAYSSTCEPANSSCVPLLSTPEISVNLSPAESTELVGKGQSATGGNVVPISFELVDNIAPVTVIFSTGADTIAGPHRSPINVVLSNNEANATLFYKVSEKDKPVSTLSAVTSTFVQSISTATVPLNQEGVYLFQFYSVDLRGNRETERQQQIVINFNQNPPVSSVDYPGSPYKFFTGAQIGVSADVLPSQTAVIAYRPSPTDSILNTNPLRDRERAYITLGDGRVPTNPNLQFEFRAIVNAAAEELTAKTTTVVLTDFSVGGQVVARFNSSATSALTTGRVLFCDTDASSALKDSVVCNNLGKRVLLQTGTFAPGAGADFACFTSQGASMVLTASGNCKPCNTPGVDCPN